MKIFIHTMYFLPDFGSAPILMSELAAYLASRGHQVEVVTTIPRERGASYRGKFFVREQGQGFGILRFWTNASQNPLGRLLAWTLYTLGSTVHALTARRGDILFLRLPPLQLGVSGAVARWFKGARVLTNVQDIHPDLAIQSGILKNPLAIRLAKAFEKWVYRNSDRIVVISDGFSKNLKAKNVDPAKVAVIPNWVDIDVLKPGPKNNPLSRKHSLAGKFVIMYSGTISISSNRTLEMILDAANLLSADRSMVFVIVGEGLKKQNLVAKASRLKLKNVVFLPFQPYRDLPRLLASADILLVPLDQEKSFLSVPSKLYNFIAAGRAVLGVADGASEVAEAIAAMRCGLCVPPDDAGGIAAAVRKLKKAPGLTRKLAAGGRAYAEKHFSRKVILKKYEELLSRL